MRTAANILIGILVLFSARRLIWVVASWARPRAAAEPGGTAVSHNVLIAVAFRNEQDSLPFLFSSIDALENNSHNLSICLVDDASTDSSCAAAAIWARDRPNVKLIALDENVGKAEALNRVLAAVGDGPDLIVVYDADQRPNRDSLRLLTAPFVDAKTDAVCGYRRPVLHRTNAVAAYACLEAWTHQLVNLAAKDRLGLNPPTMGGNCAYRRSALDRIGGFPPGAFSEDIEVSLAIANSGGRTRFIRDAVVDHAVADSFRHFLNQRLRWNRGLATSRRQVRGLEAAFVAAGYVDRVVLLLVALCVIVGAASQWWLLVFAIPALAAVITAVARARPQPLLACTVFATFAPMFVVDIGVTILATLQGITGRRIRWIDRRTAGSTTHG